MNKQNLPIIHIIGLPGAGKTTLAVKLSRKFKISIYRIGEFRSKFPASLIGEADGWLSLYRALSSQKWMNCIIETTGLNRREKFLQAVLPISRIIRVKLIAQRKILYARIAKKRKREQRSKWLFSGSYSDKYEFVRRLFKEFKTLPAEIKIDTTYLDPWEVYKITLEQLKEWNNCILLDDMIC